MQRDAIQMTPEEKNNLQERSADHNVPELVVIDLEKSSATEPLADTLIALRQAYELMSTKPNVVCILPDDATWLKLMELQGRHEAGLSPVLSAVDAGETTGDEIV